MIRAAVSRTFLRKDEQERLSPARQQRTLRTSKTALFQAVLGESYHFTYGRAVLALKESYPAYSGYKGIIPDYTALSDWLCHRVANTLVTSFPSETGLPVEKGSPQAGSGPLGSASLLERLGQQRVMKAMRLPAQLARVPLIGILLASEKGLDLTARLLTKVNKLAGYTEPSAGRREAAKVLRKYQAETTVGKVDSLKTVAQAFLPQAFMHGEWDESWDGYEEYGDYYDDEEAYGSYDYGDEWEEHGLGSLTAGHGIRKEFQECAEHLGSNSKVPPVFWGWASMRMFIETMELWLQTTELKGSQLLPTVVRVSLQFHQRFRWLARSFPSGGMNLAGLDELQEEALKLQEHLKQSGRGRPDPPGEAQALVQEVQPDGATVRPRVAARPAALVTVEDFLNSGGLDAQGNALTFELKARRLMTLEERFPSWFRFKAWLQSRMFDDEPIIMMLRFKELFTLERRGQRWDEWHDEFLRAVEQLRQDDLFFAQVNNESLLGLLFLLSLKLTNDQVSSVVKELKITTKADVQSNLSIDAVLKLVRQYVHVPQLLQKTGSPAGPAFYGSDHSSGGWDDYDDGSSWYGSESSGYPEAPQYTLYGEDEDYTEPTNPWEFEDYIWDEDWGYLSSPCNFYDFKFEEWTIAMWAEEAGEQLIFAACIDAFLASDQCAKCGQRGHWHANCPNGERQFTGKPGRPKRFKRSDAAKAKALEDADWTWAEDAYGAKGKRRKGGRKGKGRGQGKRRKGKGFSSEALGGLRAPEDAYAGKGKRKGFGKFGMSRMNSKQGIPKGKGKGFRGC